jgi:hypothetical protein
MSTKLHTGISLHQQQKKNFRSCLVVSISLKPQGLCENQILVQIGGSGLSKWPVV